MGLYAFFLLCIMFLCGRYNVVPGVHIVPKKAGFALAIVFITAITSLRFNIGYDWSNYVRMIYPKVNPAALRRLEPLSRLIISTAGDLGSPLFMFTVFAIITYGCIGRVISKHSVSKYESIMLYFCLFWASDLCFLRQAAAVAVAFYGFTYIEQKKPFRYLLVCIVAIFFHKSAVVALLLYPLYYLKPILLPFVLAAAIVGVLLVLPPLLRVANFYYGYLSRDIGGGGKIRFFYLILALYALVLHKKQSGGLFNICAIGVIFPFLLNSHIGVRIAQYFLMYFCLLIPECNKRFNINYRVVFMMIFYAYFFVYLIVTNQSNNVDYMPWQWYFLEDLDANGLKQRH